MRQVGHEGLFVVETPEVEHEAVARDPPDHRARQGAQSSRQILDRPPAGVRPDGEAGAGDRLERQRARSDLAFAGRDLDGVGRPKRPGDEGQKARGLGFDVLPLSCEEAQGRQALGEPVRVAVELQGRLDRRQPDLVDAQRPLHRIAVDGGDPFAPADDEARLRPAEQLVAREGDEVRALGHDLPHGRLPLQAVSREVDEDARSEIVHERDVRRFGDAGEFRGSDLGGEALNAIVRGMDFEDHAGLGGHRARGSP